MEEHCCLHSVLGHPEIHETVSKQAEPYDASFSRCEGPLATNAGSSRVLPGVCGRVGGRTKTASIFSQASGDP